MLVVVTRATALILSLCLASCGGASASAPSEPVAQVAETSPDEAHWQSWRDARRESLAGEDGWLTLVALVWLAPGELTIGSDPASDVVLPADRAPAHVGRLIVGTDVRFVAAEGAEVTIDGAPVTDTLLYSDLSGEPTHLALGSLRVHVIERAGRLGLRVKDQASPARESFAGLPVYAYDPRYRVRATVTIPDPPIVLGIVNVLGMQVDEPCVGIVRFEVDGAPLALAATAAGTRPEEGLFLMLRDSTAGEGETYPAGRYLEVEAPDASGQTWVDLNYLYTPPCGYTAFATCPLPPAENELAIPIRAGERYERSH